MNMCNTIEGDTTVPQHATTIPTSGPRESTLVVTHIFWRELGSVSVFSTVLIFLALDIVGCVQVLVRV